MYSIRIITPIAFLPPPHFRGKFSLPPPPIRGSFGPRSKMLFNFNAWMNISRRIINFKSLHSFYWGNFVLCPLKIPLLPLPSPNILQNSKWHYFARQEIFRILGIMILLHIWHMQDHCLVVANFDCILVFRGGPRSISILVCRGVRGCFPF